METKSSALSNQTPSTELILGIPVFSFEVAMVVFVAVGANHRVGGPLGWIVAAVAVTLIAAWGRWIAPKARHQLSVAPRTVVACALLIGSAALAAGVIGSGWAIAFALVGTAVMAVVQLARG